MDPQSNLRISYDILNFIIDQLGSEHCYNELKAFSQTCQMLLHPCHAYLLSTITLSDLNSTAEFSALLEENCKIAGYVCSSTDLLCLHHEWRSSQCITSTQQPPSLEFIWRRPTPMRLEIIIITNATCPHAVVQLSILEQLVRTPLPFTCLPTIRLSFP